MIALERKNRRNLVINTIIKPDFKDFKKSFVAFVDILGFSNKVKDINFEEDFNEIAEILNALKMEANHFNANQDIFKDLTITAISDSIIISIPYDSVNDPAITIMIYLYHLQYTLLASFKTLVRGYLTLGDIYHKDGLIFGKGYVKAYQCEQDFKNNPPKIIIDPEIIEIARNAIKNIEGEFTSIFDFLIIDENGCSFVDYLNREMGLRYLNDKNLF